MELVRCPNCTKWIAPNAPSCPHCGAVLRSPAPPQPPPPAHRPAFKPLLESAAALRRTSAIFWGIMWLAFIVQIICGIGLLQADASRQSSRELLYLVSVLAALGMAIGVTRLADAAEFETSRMVFLFVIAFIIPIAGMLIGRKIRVRLRRMSKELDSKARQVQDTM